MLSTYIQMTGSVGVFIGGNLILSTKDNIFLSQGFLALMRVMWNYWWLTSLVFFPAYCPLGYKLVTHPSGHGLLLKLQFLSVYLCIWTINSEKQFFIYIFEDYTLIYNCEIICVPDYPGQPMLSGQSSFEGMLEVNLQTNGEASDNRL